MTVKDFYATVGGDYEDAKHRFLNDEKIKKFLKMLIFDENFTKLNEAVESENYEEAFFASHALKGVTLNLSLTDLANSVSVLTETLRKKQPDSRILPEFLIVKKLYELTLSTLKKMLLSEGIMYD